MSLYSYNSSSSPMSPPSSPPSAGPFGEASGLASLNGFSGVGVPSGPANGSGAGHAFSPSYPGSLGSAAYSGSASSTPFYAASQATSSSYGEFETM